MRKITTTFLAVGAAFMSCSLASAQALKPVSTYIDQGFNGDGISAPPGASTTIGPAVTITCPTGATCTVQADQFLQVGLGSTTGNELAAGFYLDVVGVPDGQIICSTPADGTYQVCSVSQSERNVAAGRHTVQIFVTSKYQSYVFNYNTNFRVYK